MAFSLTPGLIPLESGIATFENTNPSYNNPGGIMANQPIASQFGSVGTAPNGLAIFPNAESGANAFDAAIFQAIQKGDSLNTLINTWSPPSAGNANNANYESTVQQFLTQFGNGPVNPAAPLNTQLPTPQSADQSVMGGLHNVLNGNPWGNLNSWSNDSPVQGTQTVSGAASDVASKLSTGVLNNVLTGRTAAFILGLAVIIAAVVMLRPATVENVANTARRAAPKFA